MMFTMWARRLPTTSSGVLLFFILIAICVVYMFYMINELTEPVFEQRLVVESVDSSYLIDTPGCRIPNLKAWSRVAMHYVSSVPYQVCGKVPLVESNDTHLHIVIEALPQYGLTDLQLVSCCYRPIWRHLPPNTSLDDDGHINKKALKDNVIYDRDVRYSSICYPFPDSAKILYEFVRVECRVYENSRMNLFYVDHHAFFPKPPQVNRRREPASNTPELNVMFIGVNSLSRLNMVRKMPRTFTYITDILKGIPMFGYNKIGLNTFPNLIPLLTGLTKDDLEKVCWPDYHHHFDSCSFIWDEFSKRGYVTAYMEDTPDLGMFNIFKTGFIFQPTDYYGTTLFSAALNEYFLTKYCMGHRSQVEVLLKYTHKYLRAMKRYGRKSFSFTWGVANSRDNINTAEYNDGLYFNLLRNIEMEGMLNETFLVFMSDHGLRYGEFLEARQGRLENSLPALFLVIPRWFQRKYPTAMDNVRLNQYRLLTTLDLHQTILDLLDPVRLETDEIVRRTKRKEQHVKDPVSLFLPISERRTCEDAAIPAEFCACQYLKPISLYDPIVNKTASFIVRSINEKVRDFPLCLPHSLLTIHSVEGGPPLYKVQHGGDIIKEYRVTLYTNPSNAFYRHPSNAFYEALLRYTTSDDSFQLVGKVSRIDVYQEQSDCMLVYELLPFCFCMPLNISEQD